MSIATIHPDGFSVGVNEEAPGLVRLRCHEVLAREWVSNMFGVVFDGRKAVTLLQIGEGTPWPSIEDVLAAIRAGE